MDSAISNCRIPCLTPILDNCWHLLKVDDKDQDFCYHFSQFRERKKVIEIVIFGYCDYEGDYTQPYTLVIGCPVTSLDNIPEGMVAKTILVGSYAVFRAVGEYPTSLNETWANIWQLELKRSYTSDYEFYGEKFSFGSPKEVEVCIALEYEVIK